MSNKEPKDITNKQLIGLVSARSKARDDEEDTACGGYHKYQVEDVLRYLAIVIAEEVGKGNTCRIQGIGAFSPKGPKEYRIYSPIAGGYITGYTKPSCLFKPDSRLLNYLKDPNTGEEV